MKEADVTRQVIDYLEARGWRAIRMQSGLFKRATPGYTGRVRVGEVGIPDWLIVSYLYPYDHYLGPPAVSISPALFWLELKRPGEKLRKGQPEWIDKERARGALVCVADSLESFEEWYGEVYGK